ncbi:unnamed protein product [marine sediment metagenome]|uniref:Uncharacterized protein n=1 Tax=marine sediment metagenome TaxID=412755 RepID=X1RYD0_9ZZZZ
MAKITKLPGTAIIGGFKGTLDFYVHDGQPCVRSWPRSPGHHRAPAVEAQWSAFAWAASNWKVLALPVKEAYNQMAQGTNLTGKDLFIKGYLTPLYVHLE